MIPRTAAPWLTLISFSFLYLTLFILPSTPTWFASDRQFNLLNAKRLLDGQVMYLDFFDYWPPGTEVVYLAFFKTLGLRAWLPNVILLLEKLGLTLVTFALAKRVLEERAALLAGLLFLTVGARFDNGDFHWLSILAALAAAWALIEARTPRRSHPRRRSVRPVRFFMHPRGFLAVLGLAGCLLWEHRTEGASWGKTLAKEAWLLGSFSATVLCAFGSFIWKAGFDRFWDQTVTFNYRYYPLCAPELSSWRSYLADLPRVTSLSDAARGGLILFLYALIPLVYLVFVRAYQRGAGGGRRAPWDRLALIAAVGTALTVSVAYGPNATKFGSVSPPAMILLVWLASGEAWIGRALTKLLWTLVVTLLAAYPLHRQTQWTGVLEAPAGRAAFLEKDYYEAHLWVLQHTRPGEEVLYVDWPGYYYLMDLRNPTEHNQMVTTDFTRPEQVARVVASLEKRKVRLVLWSQMGGAAGNLDPLRRYLKEHYAPVATLQDVVLVFQRKA